MHSDLQGTHHEEIIAYTQSYADSDALNLWPLG